MEILPKALVTHSMPGRVRIRLIPPACAASHAEQIKKVLKTVLNYRNIHVNLVTGSILIQDKTLDLGALAKTARSEKLFILTLKPENSPALVTRHALRQVRRIDNGIRNLSANTLNLSGSVFIVLICHALTQIIRGNLAVPSWFNSLWLAATIYNREWIGSDTDGPPLEEIACVDGE
ncbi:MAG: hypothetical protein R6U68_04610 [Desulfobacteraceae bacterium]